MITSIIIAFFFVLGGPSCFVIGHFFGYGKGLAEGYEDGHREGMRGWRS